MFEGGVAQADLLARAGFRLNRVLPTPTPLAIVEAIPV